MTTDHDNVKVVKIRQRVNASYNQLLSLIDTRLVALPTARLYQAPAPGEWTIMENLAHIVEFMPYWADEIVQLVARPGQNFGRTQQHEGRLRAISEHGHDQLQQIKDNLPSSYEHLAHVLHNLRDSDLDLTGQHVKFGERTLDWFIEDFVTHHLESHLEQLDRALQAMES
jgi:DinB family protein